MIFLVCIDACNTNGIFLLFVLCFNHYYNGIRLNILENMVVQYMQMTRGTHSKTLEIPWKFAKWVEPLVIDDIRFFFYIISSTTYRVELHKMELWPSWSRQGYLSKGVHTFVEYVWKTKVNNDFPASNYSSNNVAEKQSH